MNSRIDEILARPIALSHNECGGLNAEELFELLQKMKMLRAVEMKLALEKKEGKIKGPVHLAVGQEAIATGLARTLHSSDKVFGAHRSHPHILSLGTPLAPFFAEILGRKEGLCGGFGGSMHLQDKSRGFYGSVPIVAGTVPLAVGAALACKLDSTKAIAVAYLGDGAVEEGVVHESMNLASIMELPILFVVENNFFASHMHIGIRQPRFETIRFAEAHNVRAEIIDGNNVFEMARISQDLVSKIREDRKPAFIEAITYRHLGHVDWRDDIDVGVKRSESDLKFWKQRDPIVRLERYLSENLDESLAVQIKIIEDQVKEEINAAWLEALQSGFSTKEDLEKSVYNVDW